MLPNNFPHGDPSKINFHIQKIPQLCKCLHTRNSWERRSPFSCYRSTVFFLRYSPPVGLLIHEVSRSHTRRTTVGRTPLDNWSARRRDLYLTTHNTNRKASMFPVGFEPTISAGERPQTNALDRAATGNGSCVWKAKINTLSDKTQRGDVT